MVKITYVKSHLPRKLQRMVATNRRVIEAEQRKIKEGVLKDFNATVRTWNDPPKFRVRNIKQGFEITTNSKIYRWVDEGTREHKIPKSPRLTTWVGGKYTPKTQPGLKRFTSRKGGLANSRYVTTEQVIHPGTEAREFSSRIRDKWRARMQDQIRAALQRAARAEGL